MVMIYAVVMIYALWIQFYHYEATRSSCPTFELRQRGIITIQCSDKGERKYYSPRNIGARLAWSVRGPLALGFEHSSISSQWLIARTTDSVIAVSIKRKLDCLNEVV